jgi:endoglucanase
MKNNKIKPILSLLISTLITTLLLSCNNSESNKTINNDGSFHFEKNARVVFVGNSITHGGMFHNNILLYHVTRFPHKNILTFNCGVSGDVTWGVLDRMEEDILINKPTHAVIMLGMNDV